MVKKPFVTFLCSSLKVERVLTVHKVCLNSLENGKTNEPKCSLLDYLLKYSNIINFELEYIEEAAERNIWVQLLNHGILRQNNDKIKDLCTVTVEKNEQRHITKGFLTIFLY